MDKQREEFEKAREILDFTFNGDELLTGRDWDWELWQVAQAVMQPDIDRLASDKDELNDLVEKQEQLLSAANQRNKELEATLNQVRSTYNQIIAEDTATRNEYLDEIAKLEERIRVADAEEPYAWECTSYGQATRLTKVWDIAQFYAPCTKLYLHAQIPAEVELKEKIVELEAIIKEQP